MYNLFLSAGVVVGTEAGAWTVRGEEGEGGRDAHYDGRGEEKSDATRRSSVVTDKNILSRRGQTIKQCRARIRVRARTCPQE